jgi:hypothetical protein
MAVTISLVTSKNPANRQDLTAHQFSRLKLAVVSLAFGTSDTYATGGISIAGALTKAGITTLLGGFEVSSTMPGWVSKIDVTNTKIQFFGEGTNSSGVVALSEMANNSSAIANQTVKVLLVGY